MRVLILGSAAGGGFPQWNCNCNNCRSLRTGAFSGKARTQTQVAVSLAGDAWLLLNASPDLRLQIEATPVLHPRNGGRNSPIAAVAITSGDIDQVAGLLSLRELHQFSVYCTSAIRQILREQNSVFGMLNRVPNQVSWQDLNLGKEFHIEASNQCLSVTPFSLGSHYPVYIAPERAAKLRAQEALIGLILESSSAGKLTHLAYLPAVPQLDDSLIERLEDADLLLFDGTFWSDDELIRVQGGGATAHEMGHIPISGADGSLQRLARLKRPRKVFLHVNNTNPILDESSAEYREVRSAGWEVAEDGWQFEL